MLGRFDLIRQGTRSLIASGRAVAITAALFAAACDVPTPKIYSADPITAWVVDSETGKPIEGANVLAMWEMKYGLESHGTNYAMVLEGVTDATGKFSLPGWGPKLLFKAGAITNAAPRLTIFKSGYRVGGGANLGIMDLAPKNMKSDLNGQSLQLQPFTGTAREYSEHLDKFLQSKVESLFSNGCHHPAFPRFLKAVDIQARELQRSMPDSQFLSLIQLSNTFRVTCGDAASELRGGPQ